MNALRIKYYALFLMVNVLMFTAMSFAQEEILFIGNELGVGARAMSMGGAYIGVSDDYTSLYWNPAGLGQLRRMEMNLGFSHNLFSNQATFFGNTETDETSFTRLNSLGFVLPVPTYQGSLVFGVGYNKFRDFDNTFRINGYNPDFSYLDSFVYDYENDMYNYEIKNEETQEWRFLKNDVFDNVLQSQQIIESGSLNNWSIGGAIEVQKDFFIGATIDFTSGTDDYSMIFKEFDSENVHESFMVDSIISDLDYHSYTMNVLSKYSATGLKLGALYRSGKALRIGATVGIPKSHTVKEDWNWDHKIKLDLNGHRKINSYAFDDEGQYEYKFQEPYSFGVGASFNLLNFLLLSGDLEYRDWSQAKFKTEPPYGGTQTEANLSIKENLKDVTKIHLGAEMFIPLLKARLRAGFFRDPSPYKAAGELIDKNFISAGASFMLDRQVMADFGWIRGAWKDEATDDLTQATTYEDREYNKFVGTLSVRF
jgi:hypothetical protein